MLNQFKFTGKLILANRLDKMEYGMVSTTLHDIFYNNISEILEEIHCSPSPFISVTIANPDDSTESTYIGKLNIQKDKYGVCDFYIDQFALGFKLFNITNKKISIHIKHLEEKEIYYKKVMEDVS